MTSNDTIRQEVNKTFKDASTVRLSDEAEDTWEEIVSMTVIDFSDAAASLTHPVDVWQNESFKKFILSAVADIAKEASAATESEQASAVAKSKKASAAAKSKKASAGMKSKKASPATKQGTVSADTISKVAIKVMAEIHAATCHIAIKKGHVIFPEVKQGMVCSAFLNSKL